MYSLLLAWSLLPSTSFSGYKSLMFDSPSFSGYSGGIMIRDKDKTRPNRCNTIYKACKCVKRMVIHSTVPAHLPSEAGQVFTPTHTVHKVRLLKRWQLLYDFRAFASEGLVTTMVKSHISHSITVSHHKSRVFSKITPTFFHSVYITRSVSCPHSASPYNV